MESISIGELGSNVEMVIRSKEQIKKDIENTENRLKEIREEGDSLCSNLSQDNQDEIEKIYLDVFGNEDLTFLEKNKKVEEILIVYQDRPEIVDVVGLLFEEDKMELNLKDFQNEYVPFKAEELKNFANKLIKQIDFDKVMDCFTGTNDDESGFISDLFEEFNFLQGVVVVGSTGDLGKVDFKKLDMAEEILKDYEKKWNDKGFLIERDNLLIDKNEDIKKEGLLEKINSINEELLVSDDLLFIYRPSFSFLRDKRIMFLMNINFLLNEGKLMGGFNESNDRYLFGNKDFLKAVGKKIEEVEHKLRIEGKLTQNEEQQKIFMESKRKTDDGFLGELKINGLEVNEDEMLVITTDKIIEFLTGSFPPAFVKNIQKIEILKEEPSEDVDLNNSNEEKSSVVRAGCYKPKYDEKGNSFGDVFIYEPVCVDKNSDEIIKKIIERDFRKTLTHEIGHGVHCNLSVDDLKKWEETMKKDMTKVTWYVGYSETKSEYIRKREDFCESFMMFVDSPALLKVVSEDRFKFMNYLFEKYTEKENLKGFRDSLKFTLLLSDMIWKKNGRQKEEIRNYYLKSEEFI